MENGIHCLPCYNTTDDIVLSPKHLWHYFDVKMTSSVYYFAKVLHNSVVAMVVFFFGLTAL